MTMDVRDESQCHLSARTKISKKKKLQESHCKLRIIKKQQKNWEQEIEDENGVDSPKQSKAPLKQTKKNLKKKNVCRQVFVNQRAGLSAGLQSSL